MAKRRQIHPEIWTDEKFVSLDPLARLLFIGMWNHACDNGHLDDSTLQLKMRVLPADTCDVATLLDQIVASGMVLREGGYLKVVNLPTKQALDMRYLVFCDHCEDDPARRYTDEDRPPKKGAPTGRSQGTPRAPHVPPRGAPSSGVGVGDGDGDGDGVKPTPRPRRSPELPIAEGWKPTTAHQDYAESKGLDLSTEAFRFRNHALANDRRQRDWDAAFRVWLSKAVDFKPQQPKRQATQSDGRPMPEAWQ